MEETGPLPPAAPPVLGPEAAPAVGPGPVAAAARGGGVPSAERNFAVLAHLGVFAICLFPFGHIVAPLLIWLFRPDSAFTQRHAREALNFQLSVTGYALVGGLLAFVLVGFALLAVLVVFDIVCAVTAARRASLGEDYEYPLSIRLIS